MCKQIDSLCILPEFDGASSRMERKAESTGGRGINGERGKGIKTHRESVPCHDKK